VAQRRTQLKQVPRFLTLRSVLPEAKVQLKGRVIVSALG
jgi:hypothetical protein